MPPNLTVTADQGLRFEDGADRARVIVFGRDTGGRYSLLEWTVAAGSTGEAGEHHEFFPHLHRECEETFMVRRGSLQFLVGDEVTTLNVGDFVRVPPGIPHGYLNASGQEVNLLVSFHPGGFEELFVKYRTDGGPVEGEGFLSDAMRLHASEFEVVQGD